MKLNRTIYFLLVLALFSCERRQQRIMEDDERTLKEVLGDKYLIGASVNQAKPSSRSLLVGEQSNAW